MAGIVEDDEDCPLGRIVHYRKRPTFPPVFASIWGSSVPVWRVENTFSEKGGAVFKLALQGLYALQAADETQAPIEDLQTTEMEVSAKVRLLRDHERGFSDRNGCLKTRVIFHKVDRERREALACADKRVVTDADA